MRLPTRVSADHFEAAVITDPPVTHTRGQDEHVASLEPEQGAGLAAELEINAAFRDSEDLMGIGMEMRVVVDGVRPDSTPAIIPESLPEQLGLLGRILGQYAAIDQHGQRTVRNVLGLLEINFAHVLHAVLVYLQPRPVAQDSICGVAYMPED